MSQQVQLSHTKTATTVGHQENRQCLVNGDHHCITGTALQSWTLQIPHKNQMTHFGLNMDVCSDPHWYNSASVDLLAFYMKHLHT